MDEIKIPERSINLFSLFQWKDAYWHLGDEDRADCHAHWLAGLRQAAPMLDIYQVFPSEGGADLLVWSAAAVLQGCDTAQFFEKFARATNPFRRYLQVVRTLWGYTRPSIYSKAARSAQELDPFDRQRKAYLVIYPFVKTNEWYLLGPDARQGMMNEHIRIGKQYPEIRQLLLYSFGVQDQEFVVVYETDDLMRFSDLVNELRGADGRRYTLRDTPLTTAIFHPAEDTLALWR